MARDTGKYVYFTVGILRDSETLQKLLQDARESSMPNEIAKVLGLRIADFYRQTNTIRAMQPNSVEAPLEMMNEDIAAQNANAALDEWG